MESNPYIGPITCTLLLPLPVFTTCTCAGIRSIISATWEITPILRPCICNRSNGAVIRHDQHRNDCIQPATDLKWCRFAKEGKGSHRALLRHTSDRRFRHDQYIPKRYCQKNIHQQKNSAAILCRQIRETPDITKATAEPATART